jgi:hypothetical protein
MFHCHPSLEKRKRLAHPRHAQDEPHGKAFCAFLGGMACELEGVGAGARQLSKKNIDSDVEKRIR